MMTKVKVISVAPACSTCKCDTIGYLGYFGLTFAAVAEQLSVHEGDMLWVLHNDELDYKGFNSVAVLHA